MMLPGVGGAERILISAKAAGAPRTATARTRSPSAIINSPNAASQRGIAFSSRVSNAGASTPGEELMTCNTSAVAVCCSNASWVIDRCPFRPPQHSQSPRPASMGASCRIAVPVPARPRLPTTADRSAPRGHRPFLRFSTPGRAFHSANSCLPLSGAACNSSDATAISPSLTVADASRQSVIPSLPMM
jgi:hypothetical protein